MDILGWVLIVVLFAVGMAGAVFPILPGALAIYLGFFVYGWFFTFASFGWVFWTMQTLVVVVLFIADYVVGAWGVKRFGGSRASVIGSTIGIIVGPFAIPGFGLILGPLIGAFAGELIAGSRPDKALKVSIGSLLGLLSSTVVKIALQLLMIILFIIWVVVN